MAQPPSPRCRAARPPRARGWVRHTVEERRRLILEQAIRFFAEEGFTGQTRALAARCGVSQRLLYRHFPTKAALIDAVYDAVYLGRWNPMWLHRLRDRSLPLRDRLKGFYRDYYRTIFTYEWIRIFMYSGLAGGPITRRYLQMVARRILRTVVRELLAERPGAVPRRRLLLELAWKLHGSVVYIGIRKSIYHLPVPDDPSAMIDLYVDAFLDGALAHMAEPRRKPQARAHLRAVEAH